MNKTKKSAFIIVALAFCSLFLIIIFSNQKNLDISNNKPECWVDPLRARIIEKYKQKYGVYITGILDGMPEGIIHEVGVYLDINHVISKQKARKIIVECAQDFLHEINSHKQLQPYLKEHPFTSKNIEISLFVNDINGATTYFPDLGVVSISKGLIIYQTNDPYDHSKYKTEESETFEEAVQKVREEIPKEDLL